jgi:CRP/FNR family nitrogen fixation transcriptional regulator
MHPQTPFQTGVAVLLNGREADPRNAWFGGLAEFTSETITCKRPSEIYAEDDPAHYVWRVVSGAVGCLKSLADGRRQIVAFRFPGDLFGLLGAERYLLTTEALCDTRLLRIARRNFDRACRENVELARLVEGVTARAVQRIQQHNLLLGRMTATERLATFLLEMNRRLAAEDGAMVLPMTRRDIADYLGLTLETVSRILAHFTRIGIVNVTGREITLRRHETLMKAAEMVLPWEGELDSGQEAEVLPRATF